MNYKLYNNGFQKFVIRIDDGVFIPVDPQNTDYAEYLRWIEAGNVPIPADE